MTSVPSLSHVAASAGQDHKRREYVQENEMSVESTSNSQGLTTSWATTTAATTIPVVRPGRFPDDAKFVAAAVNGVTVRQLAPTADVTEGIRDGIGLPSTQSINWTAAHQIIGAPSKVSPQLEFGATTINSYVQEFLRLPNQTVWLYSNFSGGAIPNVPGFHSSMQKCEKMTPTYNPGMVPTFVAPAVVLRS